MADLKTDSEHGLSRYEIESRQKTYGPNSLKSQKKSGLLKKLFNQIKSPVIIILLIATAVSFAVGDLTDSIAIIAIVILNALIGIVLESKAEAAIDALKKLSAPKARVLREGNVINVPSSEVTVGDILILEAGDYVPADARLILNSQITTDEIILTGESLPVSKLTSTLSHSSILAERKNMLFAGTNISAGSAKAVVTATGMNSEMGKIAGMLETSKTIKTTLQNHLEQVSVKLLFFCAIVVTMVAFLGFIRGENWISIIMSAVSLSVAAIPEGLPAIVTIALSLASHRMARRNAIIRHLPAVETLGSTNVICTDKTGTLTTGKMSVRETFTLGNGIINETDTVKSNPEITDLLESAILCSNARISDSSGPSGDPTEIALIYSGNNHEIDHHQLFSLYPRLAEWSFDSDRKRMSVAVDSKGTTTIHVKGAPESVMPICFLTSNETSRINEALENLSSSGRRLLAVAKKNLLPSDHKFNPGQFKDSSSVENELKFLGLISMADPPKEESISAINECKSAGITVVMITGDHPNTAKAIARELGIIIDGEFDQILTGSELEEMSENELLKRVEKIAVYARVSPLHKLKIINAWQSLGKIVAMTGDGVNDAPALKKASIGISMGKGGTEVARQASSMILTDDNFSTIVSAVEEGRAVFGNIRRTIQYLLSGNLSEILIMLGAAILGLPPPLAPVQLLWINLVTDGLPSLALAAEPVPKNILEVSNRPSPQGFFDKIFYREMASVGIITSTITLLIYIYYLKYENVSMARTHAFSFLVFAELFRSFSCRSEAKTFFQMGVRSNIYLLLAIIGPVLFQIGLHRIDFFKSIFKVEAISLPHLVVLISLSLIPVTLIEIKKLIKINNPG